MNSTSNQSALLTEIIAAFKNEPYPGDANLVYDNTGFHLACIEVRDAFKRHTWQEMRDDVLSTERTALSFMSKEGFKYYLPAFMCSILKDSSVVADGARMVVRMLKLSTDIDLAVIAGEIQRFEMVNEQPDVSLNEAMQNQLVQTNTEINAFIARASQFSRVQGRAIHHFLTYTRDEYGDERLSAEADLAIQRYWFQFA